MELYYIKFIIVLLIKNLHTMESKTSSSLRCKLLTKIIIPDHHFFIRTIYATSKTNFTHMYF